MKIRNFRFRKRYIFLVLLISYVIVCQSCMTLRSTASETKDFFAAAGIPYSDTTIRINGFPLHYIETGGASNPTLFFIHGSPGSWNAYKQYLSDTLLLQKFRMIAIDRPGFGYSDYGIPEDLEMQAKLITALVRKTANSEKVILIGHSLGGPIAVKMAADDPKRFQDLIILAGSVDPGQEGNPTWRYIIGTPPLRYLIPGAMRTSNDELATLRSSLLDLQPRLKNITADVTIIHGTKDPLVPFENTAFMKKEFVNAKSIREIPILEANHFIPWEHYGEIRDVLLGL